MLRGIKGSHLYSPKADGCVPCTDRVAGEEALTLRPLLLRGWEASEAQWVTLQAASEQGELQRKGRPRKLPGNRIYF